jgi:hypothetical protein
MPPSDIGLNLNILLANLKFTCLSTNQNELSNCIGRAGGSGSGWQFQAAASDWQ